MGDLDALTRAYAGTEADAPPSVWTAAHVQTRLVEAFAVVHRTAGRIGPKQFGAAWPSILIEWEDLVDEEMRDRVRARHQGGGRRGLGRINWEDYVDGQTKRQLESDAEEASRRRPAQPTSFEIACADEAIAWCARYLSQEPMMADAIQLWAHCKARNFKIEKALRGRCVRADALVVRRQTEEDALRDGRRKAIAAEALAWRSRRLADARDRGLLTDERIKNVTDNARIRAQRALDAAGADVKPIRVKRGDVMPGKVFTNQWLDKQRKAAALALAEALHRDGVAVR